MTAFAFSGGYGSGKTMTMVSFVPKGWPGGQVNRLIVDMELRAGTYQSPDGQDHLPKQLYGFRIVNKSGRMNAAHVHSLFAVAHSGKWGELGKPNMFGIDDVAAFQELLIDCWADKAWATALAAIYGRDKQQVFQRDYWSGNEPLQISILKGLVEQFVLDLRDQKIDIILTSPFHNIWTGFGLKGYERLPDGSSRPKMRIVGRSAKLWDVWQKIVDVIWIFSRKTLEGKLLMVPHIEMDAYITKASLPGIPEQFDWPGWEQVWVWHEERTYVADVSKLVVEAPPIDPESVAEQVKHQKAAMAEALRGNGISIEQIKAAMADEYAVVLDGSNLDAAIAYVLDWIKSQSQ